MANKRHLRTYSNVKLFDPSKPSAQVRDVTKVEVMALGQVHEPIVGTQRVTSCKKFHSLLRLKSSENRKHSICHSKVTMAHTKSNPVAFMSIPVGSRLFICFHEAGHIASAILAGATVNSSSVDTGGNPSTRVKHTQDFSSKKPVACGGYAVERILFDTFRLVDDMGKSLSLPAFELQAMANAQLDKLPFYLTKPADASGRYPDTPFQPHADGTWPPESDSPFTAYALENVVPMLSPHFLAIECLASELCNRGPLDGEGILQIWGDFQP
jgi:hypothetical protein